MSKLITNLLLSLLLCIGYAQAEDDPALIEGKTVRNIYIEVGDIFYGDDLNWLYGAANKYKFTTNDKVIRRELTFVPGSTLTALKISESARNLRSLRFVRNIALSVQPVGPDQVDVYVTGNDTWTLIPQLSFSSGDGRNKRSIGISDSNLLGLGKRLELVFEEDDGRSALQTVYDDRRFLGTENQFVVGYFDRSDGDIYEISLDKPYRTIFDQYSYGMSFRDADVVGRLFKNSDERFLFEDNSSAANFFLSKSFGDPEQQVRRYTLGYSFRDDQFGQATEDDFENLDVDPQSENLEDLELADDRRFSGPFFSYQQINPNYIAKNYIDRFDWTEFYNLGRQIDFSLQYAPTVLGSLENTFLASAAISRGHQFSQSAFIRGSLNVASRVSGTDDLENSIISAETKYYNVIGEQSLAGLSLGNHTLAANFRLDYSQDLDRDDEFLSGADNFLRGYAARTFTGDKRYAINLEDRAHYVDELWQLFSLGSVIFADIGGATEENLGDLITDESYADVGIGLRLGFPRSSGSRVVRFDLAFPLRESSDGTEKYDPRFLISVSQIFDSFLLPEKSNQRSSIDLAF